MWIIGEGVQFVREGQMQAKPVFSWMIFIYPKVYCPCGGLGNTIVLSGRSSGVYSRLIGHQLGREMLP